MPILIVIAALAVCLSIPIMWFAVASDRSSGSLLKQQERTLGDVTDARALILEQGAGRRVALPALQSFGSTIRRLTPVGWVDALRRSLALQGKSDGYTLERTLVLKFVLAAMMLVGGFVFLSSLETRLRIPLIILLTIIAFFLPDAVAARRGRERQETIQRELPDTLDQLTMSVDAGLGFEAALTRAANAGNGPLADELHRTLREIQLGVPRNEALRSLADRTDVTDLDSFVLAVVQSEQYGIPVARVLRVQAAELRDKRRTRAEEQALKIPVKLIFPLAFCIFPAMFIVLLGPAVIRMVRDLSPALN